MEVKNMSKSIYGVVDSGVFGLRIVTGIVTGVQYTKTKPLFKIEYKDGSVWTDKVADNKDDLFKLMNVTPLEEVEKLLDLKIKFDVKEQIKGTLNKNE